MSATFSHAPSRLGEIIEHVPAFHVHTGACRGCWPLGRGECIVQLGFRAAAAGIMRETCCPLAWPPRPPRIFSHREPREISLFADPGEPIFIAGYEKSLVLIVSKNTARPLTGSTSPLEFASLGKRTRFVENSYLPFKPAS